MASIAVPLHSRKFPNLFAYVDEQDYDLVSQYRWNVQRGRHTFYAVAITKSNGRTKTIRMHRLIASRRIDLFIDHIDGDGLNNTRSNLREVNNRENTQHMRRQSASSVFVGVSFCKSNGKRPWKAYIGIDPGSGPKYLGRYSTEIEAALAYDRAIDDHGLATRFRNFPSPTNGDVEDVEDMLKGGFNK